MTDPRDPKAALNKAQNMVEGKGFLGWLTRLFVPRSSLNEMQAGVKMTQDSLDTLEMQQRVAGTGQTARATVKNVQDTGALINDNPVVVLTLEVKPELGAPFETTLQTPVSKIAFPRVNDEIDVKYNPSNTAEIAILS